MDDATAEEIEALEFVKAEIAKSVYQALAKPMRPAQPMVGTIKVLPDGRLDIANMVVREMTPEELDHHELHADAVLGRSPPLSMIVELQERGLGQWTGGFHDKWDWTPSAVRELQTSSLIALYHRLRKAG